MLYLWPCSGSMRDFSAQYGVLSSPQKWHVETPVKEGRLWGMDNGSFKDGFNPVRFFNHLAKLEPYKDQCLFVVAPDRVGDAVATLALWETWAPKISAIWPLAFVAQDGQEHLPFPDGCEWVFIGGTDGFKLGEGGRICIERALIAGKRVHVGRVNSQKRYWCFERMGVHSCDGSGPTREPDNYHRLLDAAMARVSLFRGALSGGDCGC